MNPGNPRFLLVYLWRISRPLSSLVLRQPSQHLHLVWVILQRISTLLYS
jgi:hypothetical protein